MGEIADAIINGDCCVYCGTEFYPGDRVYSQNDEGNPDAKASKVPPDGNWVPKLCVDCYKESLK